MLKMPINRDLQRLSNIDKSHAIISIGYHTDYYLDKDVNCTIKITMGGNYGKAKVLQLS